MKHNREDIIEKGQEIFRKNGYHATGVSEIIEECNISKGTFYNYFYTKEEFAIACLMNYSNHIQKLIETYIHFSSMSPSKRIQRYFEQLIKINDQEGANRGCLLMNFMVELSGQEIRFAKLTSSEFKTWIDLLAPTIEEAQIAKEMTNAYPAKKIANFIYLQLFGEFCTMKSYRSVNRMESELFMTFELLKP